MSNKVRPALTVILFLFLCCSTVWAGSTSVEINANTDDVAGILEYNTQTLGAVLNIGGGILFGEDDYKIGNLHIAVKDEVFTPALTLGLGFKGVAGQSEIEKRDYDIAAAGFSLLGQYDFREIYINLPLLIYAEASGATEPLSFRDTTSYIDFDTGVRAYIVRSAAVVIGYRAHKYWLEDSRSKEELNIDAFYLGLQISF
jgi:hypothetical protein